MGKFHQIEKIIGLCIFLLGTTTWSVCAQETDYTTWMKMGVKYGLNERLDLSGGLEWRTEDHLQATDRWGLDVGAKYALLPFLKVGGGYEIHYRNRGEDGWKFRHRYHAEGTLSTRWMRLKISLRERFQHTWDDEENELRLRSRLKLAYDIRDCKVEPYVSVEMYNSLNRGDSFDIARMRYRTGLSLPLFRRIGKRIYSTVANGRMTDGKTSLVWIVCTSFEIFHYICCIQNRRLL